MARWHAHLRSVAHATLAALRAHGWYPQLGVQPVLGPHGQRYAAVATGSLKKRGLSTDTQMKMVIALHDYVVGFVHREHAILRLIRRSGLDTADWSRQVGHYLTRTTNDPIFADRIAQLASHHGQDTFEFGLQSLLDGFGTHLASAR